MTFNHRRSQGYIRMICGERAHYSMHTLVERLAEEHPRSFPPSLKAVSPFYSGSNTRSSFTLFTTENDGNGGIVLKKSRPTLCLKFRFEIVTYRVL